MRFYVTQQGDLVAHQYGCYSSFPSLAVEPKTGQVIALYRQAIYDASDKRPGMNAHGLEGSLYAKRFLPTTQQFSEPELVIDGRHYQPGLIDGIITTLGDTLYLMFRRYPETPPIYVAYGPSLQDLSVPEVFPCQDHFPMAAEWGKVISVDDRGTIGQVVYGGPWYLEPDVIAEKTYWHTRAALYTSADKCKHWQFVNWISPLTLEENVSANETAVVLCGNILYALMRTAGLYPGPLFMAKSIDGGITWSRPWRSGLYGEAPMFYTLPTGQILVGFRGFRDADPKHGGTFSISEFNPNTETFSEPFVVEEYLGNHYDGGYGDLVWVPELKQLLVVYYYSNQLATRHPWIRYALLEVS